MNDKYSVKEGISSNDRLFWKHWWNFPSSKGGEFDQLKGVRLSRKLPGELEFYSDFGPLGCDLMLSHNRNWLLQSRPIREQFSPSQTENKMRTMTYFGFWRWRILILWSSGMWCVVSLIGTNVSGESNGPEDGFSKLCRIICMFLSSHKVSHLRILSFCPYFCDQWSVFIKSHDASEFEVSYQFPKSALK